MITIARFDAPEDAYLFRAFLDARGVESTVLDEHIAQWFWQYRMATGGVRVVIHDEDDFETAINARHEYSTTINAEPPLVSELRLWPLVVAFALLLGGPLILFGRKHLTPNNPSSEEDQ